MNPEPRQPKPQRLPWREKMTLCVVAKAEIAAGSYRTVLAADQSVETDFSKAEIENKFMYVGDREYPVLIAGQHSRADELLSHIAVKP
jgi:hypothetical protein